MEHKEIIQRLWDIIDDIEDSESNNSLFTPDDTMEALNNLIDDIIDE